MSYYVGAFLGKTASSLGKGFFEYLDPSVLSDGFAENIKRFDLSKVFNEVVNQFNKATSSSTENLNLKNPAENLGKEFGNAIGGMSTPTVNAFNSQLGNLFRGMTLNTVPYLASGAMVLMSAPLGTLYLYHKAKHNIGRPKLASETYNVGIIDRTTDAISRVAEGGFKAVVSGLKWGAFIGGASFTSFIPALTANCIMTNGLGSICREPDIYLKVATLLTIGSAATALSLSIASQTSSWLKKKITNRPEPKPIFNEELTSKIQDIIDSIKNTKKHGGFFQNVLLYGPGGTGKTMIAKEVAKGSNMNYIIMSGGDLAQYIKRGEHVTELNKLFETMKKSHNPTLLFIDEMESLCGDRNKMDKSELFELLNAFLSHTGEPSGKFMIMGATNKPDLIDDAVLSRMDHKLHIGPPDFKERIKIIKQYVERFFQKSEIKEFFNEFTLSKMATETEGLTGRALFKMINALYSKKLASTDNKLKQEMIDLVVHRFVNQETEIAQIREKTTP